MRSAIGGWVLKSLAETGAAERVGDEHVADVLELGVVRQRPSRRAGLELAQGRGERERVARQRRAVLVGVVLARTRDGERGSASRR